MKAYQADIAKFEQSNTQVLGISVDSFAANRRFKEDIGATFPLLSDFKRKTVREYGIYDEEGGYGTRATFTIDKDGIIRHIEQGKDAIDPTGAYRSSPWPSPARRRRAAPSPRRTARRGGRR